MKNDQDSAVSTILDRALSNAAQSLYDDYVKTNASFRSNAGLKAKIVRTMHGKGCKWCRNLAGTYSYPDVPRDVYRRHDNCSCTVTYVTEKGYQDVHNKKFVTDPKEIERRKLIGLEEDSKKHRFTPITEETISNVKEVQLSQYPNITGNEFQLKNRELLEYSRKYNNCEEVSFAFDSSFINKRVVSGDLESTDVDFRGLGNHIFVMHNHPKNSSFSTKDVLFMFKNEEIGAISIVKNNGGVEVLEKTESYSYKRVNILASRLLKNIAPKNNSDYDKFVKQLILDCEKEELVIWTKK